MPRRTFPFLLLAVAYVIAAAYVAYKVHTYKRSTRFPSEMAPTQRERSEQERSSKNNSERRDQRGKHSELHGSCMTLGITCTSVYYSAWHEPTEDTCTPSTRRGYPVPDPRCTPGGINPTVTAQVLEESGWKTRCIRDCESSESEKHAAYSWYGMIPPRRNSGENEICELDHLVPLELGGADGLGNIWPECGPDTATLEDRYFKKKDRVEDFLAEEVRAGRMSLEDAQRGIALDWTQYLDVATRRHPSVRAR